MRQKINFRNPFTGKREIGCLNPETGEIHNAERQEFNLKELKKEDQDGGIGYFETCLLGKIVQKIGKFKKVKN